MELTEWYPADITPVRKGIYEVIGKDGINEYYSYWNGKHWHWVGLSIEIAEKHFNVKSRSLWQDRIWRGIAK